MKSILRPRRPVEPDFAAARHARGFTLIEIMVGLAIGLMVTVVIAEVLVATEGRRRESASGSDAQVNGALALYTLQRDVQSAGYGLTSNRPAVGCPINAQFAGTNYTWTLAPVIIVDGGAGGAPDSIQVISSAKSSYSAPAIVTSNHVQTATSFSVNSSLGVANGDLLVAVPVLIDVNNWCSLFNVSSAPTSSLISHITGASGPWNPPVAQTIFPVNGYPIGSYLVNLGQLSDRTYSINGNALQVTTFDASTATPTSVTAFPQIVNLQALYGKDTNGDGVVDTYDTVTPTTNALWLQVLSVRIALVARSGAYNKDVVTSAQPLWDVGTADTVAGTSACGTSKCLALKINGLADWQHYRYKVYDTVIALRNMMWFS